MARTKTSRKKNSTRTKASGNGKFDISQLPYKFKLIDLKKLKPHPEQADTREITAEALSGLAGSLAEGIVEEISINKRTGHIISGHQRCKVLISMGRENVPVKVWDVDQDTEDLMFYNMNNQSIAGRFTSLAVDRISALNVRLGERAEAVGLKMLEVELESVHGVQAKEGMTDPDEVPATPKEAKTKTGDLYELGDHRLLCGDATKKEDVERLMDGEKADAVLTDPPYGINQKGVPGDEPEKLKDLIDNSVPLLPVDNAVIIAFQSTRTFPIWLDAVRRSGHKFHRILSMYKEAQCTYPWRGWILKSESILVSSLGKGDWQDVHPYQHDAYSLPEVSHEISDDLGWHGAIKPISVVSDILSRIVGKGKNVYDPFLGSGTTMIACEQLERKCYGIEIDPLYVDVCVKRWEDFTGKKATLVRRAKRK